MPISTQPMKKIEVIVDTPASRLVLRILDDLDAPGYTVLAARAGRGHSGAWDRSPVTDAREQVVIIAIVSEALCRSIVDEVGKLLLDYHGVVSVSNVEVTRNQQT
jgi:nitrogen regulatory protein PII